MKAFQLRATLVLFSLAAVLFAQANLPAQQLETAPMPREVKATRIRVAAGNISSGRKQTYDPGHGARIFQAAKPDVVAIQEFNYGDNSATAIRKFVDETFGKDFSYYREADPKLHIPNGIISRYPIVAQGSWADPIIHDRGLAWAQIRLPSGESLYMMSIHLSTKSSTNRDTEADEIVRQVRKNFPEDALLAIGGDLNTKSLNEPVIKTFKAVVGEAKAPVAADGKVMTNAPRNKRYDYILVSPSLERFLVPVDLSSGDEEKVTGTNVFPTGFVWDTRVMKLLPQPSLAEDSAAEGMQHMMIIKDFVISPTAN